MAGEWPIVTLQEACETITDGAHASPKDCPGGLPMASVKDMARWGIDVGSSRRISADDFEELVRNGCQPRLGDVLIAKDGATCLDTVCEFKQADKIVLLSSVAILRPSKRLHSAYLRYYLDCPDTRAMLKAGYVSGSAIPRVVLKDFRRAPIPLPPLAEQRAIAAVLGALDDKIELNRRMNATLESMARALFQSWFVDFDPVRAKLDGRKPIGMDAATAALFPDSFEDSEVGQIPNGWKICPLSDTIELLSGGTPNTSEPDYWNGDIPWYSVKDAPSETEVWVIQTEKHVTKLGIKNSAAQILPEGTTIISARGTVGKLALIATPMAINQSCYGVRGAKGYPDYFTYFAIQQATAKLKQRTHGTVFDTITRQTFETLECIAPHSALTQAFDKTIAPWLARVRTNLHQSRTLASLRDTLLPKLLSGELSVAVAAEQQNQVLPLEQG